MKESLIQRARFVPFLAVVLLAFAGLKAAGLWIGVTGAVAEAAPAAGSAIESAAPAPRASASERLIEHIAARKADLDAREQELETREKVIVAAERRLESAMRAMQQEKEALARSHNDRRRERLDEIGALSRAYERMKARDAAAIFVVLDDDILIPVAAGMRNQALAGVLAEMPPEKAKALTTALANRAAATPAVIAESAAQ